MVGKWHLPEDPKGFDEWKILPGQGVYFDPDFIINGERQEQNSASLQPSLIGGIDQWH